LRSTSRVTGSEGRVKFKISDIENYRDSKKVDLWEISTRTGSWRSRYVWPEPSQEERYLKDNSFERKYNERGRPGYVVREYTLESPDLEDLKEKADKYIEDNICIKSNVLVCRYYSIEYRKLYGCELKWWSLPEGREGYRVHSTGLSSKSPDELRGKVERFVKKRVPKSDLIDVDYSSSFFSFDTRTHRARITYYRPKETSD
jgi:hypothetical protein